MIVKLKNKVCLAQVIYVSKNLKANFHKNNFSKNWQTKQFK
jgi:hypothetical protein